MKLFKILLVGLALSTAVKATAHESVPGPEVSLMMSKDLSDIKGKEAIMLTVNYKPGEVEAQHRHAAHCFVYVLEGTIIMAVKGGKEVTLPAGQSFYEGPEDIHTVGRNASKTESAKFLVVMLKDKGRPPVLPVK
jgi:quercetin dioxygenase-like cupin family protein